MDIVDFKYQNFWMRVIIQIPIIVFLAIIEKHFFDIVICNYKTIFFYSISALLMFVYIIKVFKYTESPFLQKGKLIYNINSKSFVLIYNSNRKKKNLYFSDIINIKINKVNVYNVSLIVLCIEYCVNSKKHKLKFYSRDLNMNNYQEDSLYKMYETITELNNVK